MDSTEKIREIVAQGGRIEIDAGRHEETLPFRPADAGVRTICRSSRPSTLSAIRITSCGNLTG